MPGGLWLASLLALACDRENAEPTPQPRTAEKPEAEKLGAFTEYQRKSMTSEALVNLAALGDAVNGYVLGEHFEPGGLMATPGKPPPSAPLTPALGTCCMQPKGLCPAGSVDWSHEGFKALSFAPTDAHRYSYAVDVDGDKITVRAQGDLDCDGNGSSFTRVGTINGDEPISWTLTKTDPLE